MDAPPPMNDGGNGPTPPPTANPDGPKQITITFKDNRSFEQSFKLKTTTKMGKAMDAFSAKVERDRKSLRFFFDGVRVNGPETVDDLAMEDGDVIEVHEEQVGGGQ